MKLVEFFSNRPNTHADQGQMPVKCNAVYKTRLSFNCNLTPTEAIEVAQNLLAKAKIIVENDIRDAVVQLWNKGSESETLYSGITDKRLGPRRKKKTAKSRVARPVISN